MRYDVNGYICVSGSSDSEDSSHLAGLLKVTQYPIEIDWDMYIKPNGKYQRCKASKYDFSRDQFSVMAAGMIKSGHGHLVSLERVDGKDLMPFSVRGLVRIAQGKKPYFYQTKWLTAEIYWHSYLQPLDEPFQLLAMILTYDNFNGNNELLKLWTSKNNKWRWSIYRYWSQLDGFWRQEPELAEHVIKYVESRLNG